MISGLICEFLQASDIKKNSQRFSLSPPLCSPERAPFSPLSYTKAALVKVARTSYLPPPLAAAARSDMTGSLSSWTCRSHWTQWTVPFLVDASSSLGPQALPPSSCLPDLTL